MSRLICLLGLLVGALSVFSLTGCGQSGLSVDPELLAKYRVRLTLAEEPEGAQVVPEVRDALLGISDDHAEHPEEDGRDHAHHENGDVDDDKADGENGDDEADEDDDEDELDHDDHADHADHDGHHNHNGHDHGATALINATEPMEVVLVGQIGGLANPWKETQPDFPFARNQAAFFLADTLTVIENEESGHVHAPGEECAFCETHAADRSAMLAMVRFLDEKGEVLRMDVRDLFDVKESDTVVIQGIARVIEGGMMVVDATGLYLRQ